MDTTTAPHDERTDTDDIKAKADDAASAAQERIQDAAGQAQEKLHEVRGQVRDGASDARTQAKGRLRTEVDSRSDDLGKRAGDTAESLRSVSSELRNQGKHQPADLADQVAGRVEDVAGYLQRSDADALLGDLERAGRERPWAVIAGGIAIGFVASRLLKTSSTERYRGAAAPPAAGRPTTAGNATSLGRVPAPTPPAAKPVAAASNLIDATPDPAPGVESPAGTAQPLVDDGEIVRDGRS